MTEQQELLFKHFDHVAIAVRDIDEAARKMEDVLGVSATVTRDMNEDGYRAAIVPLRTGAFDPGSAHRRKRRNR